MINEVVNSYLLYDGEAYRTDSKVLNYNIKKSVYEVIRVINGVPLFFEEHIERMYKSAKLVGIELCLEKQNIKPLICKLMNINNEFNSNIKILFNEDGKHYYIYFMNTFYPSSDMFQQGVHTVLFVVERNNPNAKVNNQQQRKGIDTYKEKHGAYEALLVDIQNNVTEGSRSNIFFVENNTLYTAPNKKVLLGITRSKVITIAKKLSLSVREVHIKVKDLKNYDGVFLTSTSNNIMPIKSINNITYHSTVNPVICKLKSAYLQEVAFYLDNNKVSI